MQLNLLCYFLQQRLLGRYLRWGLMVVLLVLPYSSAHAVTQVEIIADDNYPPFSYREGFKPAGLYPEILTAVFARMPKYKVIVRPLPWRRGLAMMQEGTGFAIFPPYYFPDKRPYLSDYSPPLLEEQVTLFCSRRYVEGLKKSLNRVKLHWPEDFAGAVVGINPGYLLLEDDFWGKHHSGFYHIEEGISNRGNLLKLASGRMSCLVNSRMSVFWDLKNLVEEAADIKPDQIVQMSVLSSQQGYLAFSFDNIPTGLILFASSLKRLMHSRTAASWSKSS
ncbi:substrate-binding periplasmic protein [Oceanospirillum beijerinckii]|uniref:substrate-binding periplasmic protein n=1 Tax=Oceanospirillum beijerinckii TaxID=64976 RepID=UPI0003FFFAB0|nr:transporter substrate-binding domain-containing protein [Oceanospirillum beijerinckii]